MNNYWGPQEENEDGIPAWMLADTYRNGNQLRKPVKSLEEACADALKKPAIDVSLIKLNEHGK
jgi:hypothetical protein